MGFFQLLAHAALSILCADELQGIDIDPDLTNYFKSLCRSAEIAKENQQISSFWIGEHGLYVKTSPTSKISVVKSKVGLFKLIRPKE